VSESAFEHQPVLVNTVLRLLDPQPGQVVLDGTVGLGGHAAAILPRLEPGGRYVGLDVDDEVLRVARERLTRFGPAATLVHANYAEFPAVLADLGVTHVHHMLLDLGVNSAQLDDPARGFSFDREGPLDMRFDRTQKQAAVDLVNRLSEKELADLFYEFGQEGMSRKIARRICQVRHSARITTTQTLAAAVASAYESAGSHGGKIHPATRVFQALRVAVNRELEHLARFLEQAPEHLAPGGRIAVISFHSLEDGLVKKYFRDAKAAGTLEEITRRPEIADEQERQANPRSRSAKLRVAQRLAVA
jgi:16S rRNA (cytosine1402-N4)-methyltransferase